MTKLPPGVEITTPTGRRATVMHYDADERVHVKYVGGIVDRSGNPETGCFPGKLAKLGPKCPQD